MRPTRGILWPGDQEQITITLRALRKPPSDADDCRDRFKALSLPEPCPASSLTLAPTLTLTLPHPSSLTLPRAFKVLSLPLEHGQAAQLREVARDLTLTLTLPNPNPNPNPDPNPNPNLNPNPNPT